ncbi:hypothetical protein KBX10_08935 [Corynebacterium sp. CCUG 59401]|nr:hypothetical protein [Corynebacterium pseudogenitalium]
MDYFKKLSDIIKELKSGGDFLFQLVGFVAAVTTLIALYRRQTPTQVWASAVEMLGAQKVGDKLENELPLILDPDKLSGNIFLLLSALTVLSMSIAPFFKAKEDNWRIIEQARGLLGCRAASSFWILLLAAAQFVTPTHVPLWVIGCGCVLTLLYLLGGSFILMSTNPAPEGDLKPEDYSYQHGLRDLSWVLSMVVLALIFVIAGPIFIAVLWLCSVERETLRKTKIELARDNVPSGSFEVTRGTEKP